MADLDSFFAKKDKKKVKGKKFTTTDEIAKRLEETEKKLEKEVEKSAPPPKKIEENLEEEGGTVTVVEVEPKKEEEDWNDFEPTSDKDLTDLKISKLNIEDEDESGMGGGTAEDGDEKGDVDEKRDGVWKKEKAPAPPPQIQAMLASVEVDEAKLNVSASNTASSYVPPHLRNVASPLPRGGGYNRRNKQAPDITNEMAFPSLSDAQAANPVGAWGRKKYDGGQGFENVKHGSLRTGQDDYASPKLSTANRFDALSDNS